MVAGETLEYSDQAFKGECPPGMDRAKKNQIVINVEGSMVIRSDVECRVYLLQVPDITCNARAVLAGSHGAHCPRASNGYCSDKLHGMIKDLLEVRV